MQFKDITPSRVRDFIQGNALYALKPLLPAHMKEQAVYRSLLCNDCAKAGHCLECKCPASKVFLAPNKKDEIGKWGPMLSKKDWEEFKKTSKYLNLINDHVARNDNGTTIDNSEHGETVS